MRPSNARDIDDLSLAGTHHHHPGGSTEVKGAAQVRLYYLVPIVRIHRYKKLVADQSRVVHNYVQLAPFFDNLVYDRLGTLEILDIGLEADSFGTGLLQFLKQLFGCL